MDKSITDKPCARAAQRPGKVVGALRQWCHIALNCLSTTLENTQSSINKDTTLYEIYKYFGRLDTTVDMYKSCYYHMKMI